jgi:hypothetical protein
MLGFKRQVADSAIGGAKVQRAGGGCWHRLI